MEKKSFALLAIVILFGSFKSQAQKLPNIQEVNLRAPAGVKIDGKSTEWTGQLQAHNKAVDVTYAIANDDENLYLVMQATKPRIVTKIIDVGTTLIINSNGKKKADAKENITITYPLLEVIPAQRMLWYAGAKARPETAYSASLAQNDTTQYSTTPVDSLVTIANNLFGINAKMIEIAGISSITEPIISVYNEEHIKAAARFDNLGVYTYELAIPLKYLGLSTENPKEFSYSIRLESRLTNPKLNMRTVYTYPNRIMTDVDQDLDSTTDFWGTYILAKK